MENLGNASNIVKVENARKKSARISSSVIKTIADKLKKGLHFSVACSLANVTPRTGRRWLDQGSVDADKNLDTLYAKFFSAVGRSSGECQELVVDVIMNSIRKGDAKMGLKFLKARHSKSWDVVRRREANITSSVTHNVLQIVKAPQPVDDENAWAGMVESHNRNKVIKPFNDNEKEIE